MNILSKFNYSFLSYIAANWNIIIKLFQAFLSLAGLSCIGLTILVSYGLCSAFGLLYGPMHNVITFLILGDKVKHCTKEKINSNIY